MSVTAIRPAIVPATLQRGHIEQPHLLQKAWRQIDFRADQRPPMAQDAGFLVTDRIATVAQVIAVVQTDTGDYRHMGVDYIDRIQATAQAYFQNHGIQPGPPEQPERR